MKHLYQWLSLCVFTLCLQGCAFFDWLIYQPDITQGNYITEERVKNLRISMTREQVHFVLGKSIIKDGFDDTFEYYIYYIKKGGSHSFEIKHLAIEYKDGAVIHIDTEYELSPDVNTPL